MFVELNCNLVFFLEDKVPLEIILDIILDIPLLNMGNVLLVVFKTFQGALYYFERNSINYVNWMT